MTYEEYPPNPYVPSDELLADGQTAYIVDIDGTIADHSASGRGHYEYDRVGEDEPISDVIRVVETLGLMYRIVFVSGRDASCRNKTRAWIDQHLNIPDYDLYMRPRGDRRPDTIIKRELFDQYIRYRADILVVGVFDDRNRVAKMWREQLGLTVFHVADHDF